jgi:hypothetical protein
VRPHYYSTPTERRSRIFDVGEIDVSVTEIIYIKTVKNKNEIMLLTPNK